MQKTIEQLQEEYNIIKRNADAHDERAEDMQKNHPLGRAAADARYDANNAHMLASQKWAELCEAKRAATPKQSAMFQADDLPLFSGTCQPANDERYTPQPAAPKQSTFQSFQEETNRAPIAGIDFDPNAPLCQDDYEYLTGTGNYAPQPSPRELSNRATNDDNMTECAECLIDELIPYADIDPRALAMINALHNAIAKNHKHVTIPAAEVLLSILKKE